MVNLSLQMAYVNYDSRLVNENAPSMAQLVFFFKKPTSLKYPKRGYNCSFCHSEWPFKSVGESIQEGWIPFSPK